MSEEEQNKSLGKNNDQVKESDDCSGAEDNNIDKRTQSDMKNVSYMELLLKKKRSVKGARNEFVIEGSEDRNHFEFTESAEGKNYSFIHGEKQISETFVKEHERPESNVVIGHENDNSELRRRETVGLRNSIVKNYEEEWSNDEIILESKKSTKSSKKRSRKKMGGKSKKAKEKKGRTKTEESKENGSDFEVEKIIDVKYLKNGKKEFLIRWKGFSANDDTWEPEDNLNCKDLVNAYFKTIEKETTGEDEEENEEDEVKLSGLRKRGEENPGRRRSSRVTGNRNHVERQNRDTSGKRSEERVSRYSFRLSKGNISVSTQEDDDDDKEISNTEKGGTKIRKTEEKSKRKMEESDSTGKNKRGKKDQDKENLDKTRLPSSEKSDESGDSGMEDAGEFEVQKIVDVRHLKNGSREFFIKWKGYSSKHNSWEPEKHLNCSDKLKEFLQEMEKNNNIPIRELRFYRKKTDRLTLESPRTRKLSSRIQRQPRKSYIEDD